MAPKIPKPRGWDAGRCRFISETYLGWFLEFAEAEARRSGAGAGAPTKLGDLRELAERFRESQGSTQALFQSSFFSCNQARLNSAWKNDLGDHLLRLLIEPIFPLFAEEGGPRIERGGLSRRMMPGLFEAIVEIVGTGKLEDCDRECSTIVERLRDDLGDDFEWDDYFNAPEARRVLVRILADLALSFDDFDLSREDFIAAVNRGHAEAEGGARPDAADWHFDETQFATFARHFFVPLVEARASEQERTQIARHYDPAALDQIANFLDQIAEQTT